MRPDPLLSPDPRPSPDRLLDWAARFDQCAQTWADQSRRLTRLVPVPALTGPAGRALARSGEGTARRAGRVSAQVAEAAVVLRAAAYRSAEA